MHLCNCVELVFTSVLNYIELYYIHIHDVDGCKREMRTETSNVDCKLLWVEDTKIIAESNSQTWESLGGSKSNMFKFPKPCATWGSFRRFWSGLNRFPYHNHMGLWEKKWIPFIDSCENDNRTVMFLVKKVKPNRW